MARGTDKTPPAVRNARGGYWPSGIPKITDSARRCPVCRGSGELAGRTSPNSSSHGLTEYVQCSTCDGTGATAKDALRRAARGGPLMTDRTYDRYYGPSYP